MYVNYSVGERDFQVGPYSPNEAEWQMADIAGYAHVHKVFLAALRDEKRTLICEAIRREDTGS